MESVDRISEIKASIDAGRTIRRVDVKYLLIEIAAMRIEIKRLKEAQRWIPVEEKLPAKSQNCLCRFRDGSMAICWSNAKPYKFHPDVTHWQPLPVPPANGGGNAAESKQYE